MPPPPSGRPCRETSLPWRGWASLPGARCPLSAGGEGTAGKAGWAAYLEARRSRSTLLASFPGRSLRKKQR